MIEARGLVKRYGATAAVNDLSFTIRPGLVTGFLGPNGAGKTTTMRLILGLDYPSAGTATVNGRPYPQLPDPMHEVGALLDAGAVPGGRTARNHLLGLAQTNGISRRRVDEVLGLVGLADVAGQRAKGFASVSAAAGDVATGEGEFEIRGLTEDQVSDLAFAHGIRLYHLAATRVSLEHAFMELTADSVEYRAAS